MLLDVELWVFPYSKPFDMRGRAYPVTLDLDSKGYRVQLFLGIPSNYR